MCDEKKKLFLSFSSPVTLACHAMPCNAVPFNRLRKRGRANWVWYLLACSLCCHTARVTTFAFLLSIMHVLGGGVFLLMYVTCILLVCYLYFSCIVLYSKCVFSFICNDYCTIFWVCMQDNELLPCYTINPNN